MQSFREPTAANLPSLFVSPPIAVEFTVGMGTVSLLALLASGRALAAGLAQLGEAGEEIFRGEQLPTLPLMRR